MKRFPRALALSTLALTSLGACGSDGDASSDTTTAAASSTDVPTTSVALPPTSPAADTTVATTTAAADATTVAEPVDPNAPQRIVSLSPTATETLFALGAGDQVVAVDDQSNYPEEAASVMTDLSGYTPNIEAIAAFEPDLVVIADDTQDVSGQLANLGIETIVGVAPTNFDDIYVQIEELGAITGHIDAAIELVAQMKEDIQTALDSVTVLFEVAPRIYHELDNTLFSINSNTFIGQVYSMFGLQNIADTAEGGSDYPQLSAEFIISQNPDIIFLADAICCGESAETVSARPGWDAITAVQNGDVIPVDEDVASRWGPRIVQYVEFVAAAVNALAPISESD
jgi:iron complex transport system substrate-binding protein